MSDPPPVALADIPVKFDPSTAGKVEGNLASGIVPDDKLLAFKDDPVIYPAPFVIALLFKEIFAEPSNETPAIVLAVAKVAAVLAAIPRASISDLD